MNSNKPIRRGVNAQHRWYECTIQKQTRFSEATECRTFASMESKGKGTFLTNLMNGEGVWMFRVEVARTSRLNGSDALCYPSDSPLRVLSAYLAAEFSVFGQIELTHTACAELRPNLVAPNASARRATCVHSRKAIQFTKSVLIKTVRLFNNNKRRRLLPSRTTT